VSTNIHASEENDESHTGDYEERSRAAPFGFTTAIAGSVSARASVGGLRHGGVCDRLKDW